MATTPFGLRAALRDRAVEMGVALVNGGEDAPTEESESAPKQGKLPDGFPGKDALEAAGITTFARLRKQRDGDGLTAVVGIGPATAAEIELALEE